MSFNSHIQKADLGAVVILWQIDLSVYDLSPIYLTSGYSKENSQAIIYDGITYAAFEIEAEGFEVSGAGSLPSPTLTITNPGDTITGMLVTNNDLLGATVTRIKTYETFLDTPVGATPDPTASHPPDVYVIDEKTYDEGEKVTWNLKSATDQEDVELPAGTVIRDYCPLAYRVWDGVAFDYTNATCDYDGTNYFDRQDGVVTAAADSCGKKLSSCKLRFGATAPLTFGGMPGVDKLRLR